MTRGRDVISAQDLIADVISKSGRSRGWPQTFIYGIDGDSVSISADSRVLNKKTTRRLDPWGLAFLIEAESRCDIRINSVNFAISGRTDQVESGGRLVPALEALRRRVSFLDINNPGLRCGITINGGPIELDDAGTLFARPEHELIHERIDRKAMANEPGRLEKDFQTWLSTDAKTNVRLAVLGEHFFKLEKRDFGAIREFPTGVFDRNISPKPTQKSRILPTEFVDIVTLNKYGQLALIELKLNDSQLEVIAQLLDYSLFFRCYRDKLWPIMVEKLRRTPRNNDIVCYVVNNYFHKRFDDVLRYYSPKNELHGFKIIKTLLGHYSDR